MGSALGKGKRGGARVIYYYHSEAVPLFLIRVYAKSKKANLTAAERKQMRRLVAVLLRTIKEKQR